MAVYSVRGNYFLYKTTQGGFLVNSTYVQEPADIVLTVDSSGAQEFTVGQTVTLKYPNDPTYYEDTIVAFTTDGVITVDVDGMYYFYTNSSSSYVEGTDLMTNSNPFPVCFVKGTRIDTDRGAVTIESLVVGDKVAGRNGWGTVKWVGWRNYSSIALRSPQQRAACLPVRILAGALGDNQPSRDLRVSPWHHLYVDGVLIRANDLINGKSIIQESNTTEFSYYHVELEQFDVIRAYGVYSESYADGGNRDFFQNVDVTTLRPEDTKRRLAPRPGFTVLRKADEIAAIRDRLAARADAHFSALDKAA